MKFIVKLYSIPDKVSFYYATRVDIRRIEDHCILLMSDSEQMDVCKEYSIDGTMFYAFEIYNGMDSKLLHDFHFTSKDAGSEIDMPQIIVGRKHDQSEEIIDLIDKAINEGNESLYIDHYVSDSSWLEIEMKYKGIAVVKFQKLPILERDATGNYYKLTIIKTDHATGN